MKTFAFDVIIIGAGPAGITAAGALAGSGISVAVIEAGVYAGAENWSGCVYFTESLAAKDCFGPAAVQNAPFERTVVRRGTLVHNGMDSVGAELSDPAVFRHCYTVLRPVFDPYFAGLAKARGTVIITETTVTSLIRKAGRVIGVSTGRGPLYASVVFIAEGDASHLVRAEGLERVDGPHYLQGVKAVLSLPPGEIEQRFHLRRGEGAAYEILVRNAAIAGRTARLNAGGFLYTNRDSLSFGYVLPLDNLKKHYRGDHGLLLEWMRSLPRLRDLLQGAALSAYGTKIIRSGGWRERPVLVGDGLAVGGASAGLGIDLPFPNFTGPASASGLFFARAVKALLRDGRSLDARNLAEAYVEPLRGSVYGRNARHLSRWPGYFGRSTVLFGRTADVVCGAPRFLSDGGMLQAGRFLRRHLLSVRGVRELAGDTAALMSALRLWKPVLKTVLAPATWAHWSLNLFRAVPRPDPRLRIIVDREGAEAGIDALPWPVGQLLRRTSPALSRALSLVYANDERPMEQKFSGAVRTLIRSLSITDLVSLPLFALSLIGAAVVAGMWDAFRYYVLRTPAATLLAEPVMAYHEALRKARDLAAVSPSSGLEAKLATNSYRVGMRSHIRVLWPQDITKHPDIARAGLWWVCPAGVYGYDAPLAGRGGVSVNWENCIKCESCWRAEPAFTLWGRFTDHRLIYRPRSSAVPLLLSARRSQSGTMTSIGPREIDKQLWYTDPAVQHAAMGILNAASAFRDAVFSLPASADSARRTWPALLGERLCGRIAGLEQALNADGHHDASREGEAERKAIELRLSDGRLLPALYCAARLEQRIAAWMPALSHPAGRSAAGTGGEPSSRDGQPVTSDDVRKLFPDRVVKEWEEQPMPEEWAEKLRAFVRQHRHPSRPAIRALSAVSPALGLVAASQMRADRLLSQAGRDTLPGLCAVDAEAVAVSRQGDGASLAGTVRFVPTAAATSLLVIVNGSGYIVPLDQEGVTVVPAPAIGFRSAGLADVDLLCTVGRKNVVALPEAQASDPASYLSIALGAGDYLSRRAREHAAQRVQFTGQLLDTEGRDGIAKFGAVKAMVARVEAWRLLLEMLHDAAAHRHGRSSEGFLTLCSALSSLAFGPENGSMAYDAGQVFGGFAYSEDDLLSRYYRDSSLFRFLPPGDGAAGRLDAAVDGQELGQAFSDELGALPARPGRPLDGSVRRWERIALQLQAVPAQADRALRGGAKALLLATRALITRVEETIDGGSSAEAEAACAEVLLNLAESAVMHAEVSAGRGAVPPGAVFPMEPDREQVPLDPDYASFCARPAPAHRSGTFLLSVFDRSPRYVPEMQLHDPDLRQLWSSLAAWFSENCRDRDYGGLPFERHVEKSHALPDAVIDAVRKNKWLATSVPQSEDGLGWRKARYYVLNSVAGSHGDAAICLLIMASTSIGTTPVVLGLEEELPRVREELEPLVRNAAALEEIGSRVRRIVASFRNPSPGWIRKEYGAVLSLVDSRIRRTRVVKYLAANFLRSFYGAGSAGQRGDFAAFMAGLAAASLHFERILPDVRSALAEVPRRERCHRLFLRALGHGGISAFALTEPTAGSDSGGVRTTAVLKAAMLSPLPDGRYAFSPTGEMDKCLRYLIDADRIVFTEEGMAYLAPDGRPAPIRFDRYDYAADRGARAYEYQGALCEFHDIGQVRTTDRGPVYEYYSLTGAKMWITNGSLATQFSLFAQAAEGVTGFMVDRHAEGLKVGADEKKTGQRGSPTNELSLDGVRVPREAVIGYEGHGQVNALETLNVGRCGLAVVAGSLARKVLAEARREVPPSLERDRLLGEAAAILFGSESLAFHLIGLFDRPHESVRMESAIAKFLCSEDIHEILSLVEQAFGPEGQTERRFVEKARRDARILNIYEGTNEVQRFLVLKDLAALAADWPELPERLPERPGDERAEVLAQWKNRIKRHVREAAEWLGDAAWSDAMLQPVMFLQAEMAAEVLRLECIWYRTEWLGRRRQVLGEDYTAPLQAAGARAAELALARLVHLERRYRDGWERIRMHRAVPEVQAADALLDRTAARPVRQRTAMPAIDRKLSILAVLRPVADLPPDPQPDRGILREIVWMADPRDRSGLDQALALKAGNNTVRVDVLLAGGPEHEGLLRAVGASADSLIRLESGERDPAAIAAAVRGLEQDGPYDLILCGSPALDGGGALAPFLSGFLERALVSFEELTGRQLEADTPIVVEIRASLPAEERRIGSLLPALQQEIRTMQNLPAPEVPEPVYAKREMKPSGTKTVDSVAGAAEYIKVYAAKERTSVAEAYDGSMGQGGLFSGPAAWALLGPESGKADAATLRAARLAADLFSLKACVLITAPRASWPALLGIARMNGAQAAFCVDIGPGTLSDKGRSAMLRPLMGLSGDPLLFAGPDWNNAFGIAAGALARTGRPFRAFQNCIGVSRDPSGLLIFAIPAYDGKLIRKEQVGGGPAFITLAENAELPAVEPAAEFKAVAADLSVSSEWTEPPSPAPAPSLARAEVIIDIGYGVRDAAGLALAKDLKAALEQLGLAPFFGATRKVTQDLKLLPLDVQIGQTGVRVDPKLVIALGISGAPQHLDYLGHRADILCFNKDPEAPLMKLSSLRPSPRVHPIAGDLFITVRELIERLRDSS